MKFLIGMIWLVLFSCQDATVTNQEHSQENIGDVALEIAADDTTAFVTVDFEGLEEYIDNHKSQTLVINFWATWCKPCIKELPAFERLGAMYKDKNLAIILVSLDFPEQLDRLEKFIKKKNIQSEVVFLNDGDANGWIPKVHEKWSGAIPATLVKSKNKKDFYERSFTYNELEIEVQSHINL